MRKAIFPVCMNILVPLALLSSAAAQTTMPAPTFYPPAGTYQARQQVALWDTAGPTGISSPFQIFYTTDGSTPSFTHGNQYNGAITVNGNETIKAIEQRIDNATVIGSSAVSTAVYVVKLPAETPLQQGEWAWESGSSTIVDSSICGPYGIGSSGTYGAYGARGLPAAGNAPGSREGAMTWTDKNGYLWLFGGFGNGASGECNQLNDLWMFNINTEEWTWMGGSSTPNPNIAGVYGTLGQFAAANMPGSRVDSVTWTDLSGNLWLFGGSGYDSTGASGDLNDLWVYNTNSHEWAWMAGSKLVNQRGAYGTFGQFHSGNIPGARYRAISWVDGSGNFWLFGGSGYDGVGTSGYLSDLWEFNSSSKQWAWMSGSHYANGYGAYGTIGTPSVYNHPGGRSGDVSWVDKDGNLWLFGGEGYAAWGDSAFLNDLWEFNSSTLQWTWVTGYNGPGTAQGLYFGDGQPGAYGTLTVPEPGNTPGSRYGAAAWTDKDGNFWLWGGNGFDSVGTGGNQTSWLNDLWEFQPSTRLWTWMGGSNTIPGVIPRGNYGSLHVPSSANLPGARWGSSSWVDASGNLWLFGGEDLGYENDLWKYQVP